MGEDQRVRRTARAALRVAGALAVALATGAAGLGVASPVQAHSTHVYMFGHSPPRLGIGLQRITPDLREFFEVPRDRGVLVSKVKPGQPAEEAGVRVGDVILAIDGEPVSSPHEVVKRVAGAPAGEPLTLEISRKGDRLEIAVVPQGEPSLFFDEEQWEEFHERMRRGLRRGSRELRERLEDLERRLEELERQLDPALPPDGERT